MKKQKRSKPQRSSKPQDNAASRNQSRADAHGQKHDDIAIGRRTALELLSAGAPVRKIVLREGVERDDLLRRIMKVAESSNVQMETVPPKQFDSMNPAGLHAAQGILCMLSPYAYCEVPEIIPASTNEPSLVVVCDHVTDSGNLGAVIRSADSVGASGIIIPNRRSAQVTASTYKTSAGAIIHQKVACVPNLSRALSDLKEAGYWVIGATERAQEDVWDCDLKGRIALVVGNEHDGISDLVLENCDVYAKLPQRGEVDSLNVAQASTAFMYEWLRQNRNAI